MYPDVVLWWKERRMETNESNVRKLVFVLSILNIIMG